MAALVACQNTNNEKFICTNCSSENIINVNFCSFCGISVNNTINGVDSESMVEFASCLQCNAECEIGHSYCKEHECSNKSCIMQRKSGSYLCVSHSCRLCGSQRNGSLAYCYKHTCDACANMTQGTSNYCVNHKCLLCDRQKFMGDLCSFHG